MQILGVKHAIWPSQVSVGGDPCMVYNYCPHVDKKIKHFFARINPVPFLYPCCVYIHISFSGIFRQVSVKPGAVFNLT